MAGGECPRRNAASLRGACAGPHWRRANHFAGAAAGRRIVDADSFALSVTKTQLVTAGTQWFTRFGASYPASSSKRVEAFSHNGLLKDSDDARRYLAEHDDALAFAQQKSRADCPLPDTATAQG